MNQNAINAACQAMSDAAVKAQAHNFGGLTNQPEPAVQARDDERVLIFDLGPQLKKRLRGSVKFGGWAPIFAIGFTDRYSFIFLFWCLHCGITWDY